MLVKGNQVALTPREDLANLSHKQEDKKFNFAHIFHDAKIFSPVLKSIFAREIGQLKLVHQNHLVFLYGPKYTHKKILFS
jgi:hypothetical protein